MDGLPPRNDYCRFDATSKQRLFYDLNEREVFFGGAAGGGKSVALLMAALKYVHTPGYAALILRKDFSRLQLAGGLVPRSHEWFQNTPAQWIASRRQWLFPIPNDPHSPPATIMFGYLSRPLDKFRYASSEFQYIAFDELTDFAREDYLFLFSRLRRVKRCPVPLRMRSASNPGGMGHAWVKERFIPEGVGRELGVGNRELGSRGERNDAYSQLPTPNSLSSLPRGVFEKEGRLFVPSRIDDNPYLDGEEYRQSLLHLPPVERERLMNGDWTVQERGQFHADWLRYFVEVPGQNTAGQASSGTLYGTAGQASSGTLGQVELMYDGKILATIPEGSCWRFITIDPAGTSEERTAEVRGRTPSWSVVQIWDQPRRELSKFLLLRHQERKRVDFAGLCAMVRLARAAWRPEKVFVEGERLGQALLSTLKAEFAVESISIRCRGKVERAVPLINKMQRGEVFLPQYESSWRREFESEVLAWTGDKAEPADQIDAAAYAAHVAEERGGGVIRVI